MNGTSFADEIAATGITVRSNAFRATASHRPPYIRATLLCLGLVAYIGFCGFAVWISFYGRWFIDMVESAGFATPYEAYDAASVLDSSSSFFANTFLSVMCYCILTYCLFVYGAASNIVKASARGLDVTPGWAVGWSFIPFVNLFKIYSVMRQIWSASADPIGGERVGTAILAVWWPTYIAGNVSGRIVDQMATPALASPYPDLEQIRFLITLQVGSSSLSLLAGVLLLFIVIGVTRNQGKWRAIAAQLPPSTAPLPGGATATLGF